MWVPISIGGLFSEISPLLSLKSPLLVCSKSTTVSIFKCKIDNFEYHHILDWRDK
jgi:hypothetical protein